MTLRRALVVINPKAGRGFGTRLTAKPEPTTDPDASTVAKTSPSARFLASPVVRVYEDAVRPMLVAHCFELDEVYAETRGDVYRACASADLVTADVLVVVGGDGTVHEAINGILRNRAFPAVPPVAVVPCGTGNAVATACGLRTSMDVVRAVSERNALPLGVARVSVTTAGAAAAPAPAPGSPSSSSSKPGSPQSAAQAATEPAYAAAVVSLGIHAETALGGKNLRMLGRLRFALTALWHTRVNPRKLEGKLTLTDARRLVEADSKFSPREASITLDGPFWYLLATPCERLTPTFRIAPWAMAAPRRVRAMPPARRLQHRPVAGDAGVDGGEWDVIAIRTANASPGDVWDMLKMATSSRERDITKLPFVEYFKARGLSFGCVNYEVACVDGEPLEVMSGGALDITFGTGGISLLGLRTTTT